MARIKRTTRGSSRATRKAGSVRTFGALRATAMKAVDSFLEQGARLRARGEKLAVARARRARAVVMTRAGEARTRATEAMTQLEKAFQARVSTVVSGLGVPHARDVRALSRQVAQLQQSVEQLRRARART
jgi:poly(hydroxyalkanoate) granule-associated protein